MKPQPACGWRRFSLRCIVLLLLSVPLGLSPAFARLPLPEEQIRVEFNHYTGSFGVNVLYPAVSIQKQVSRNTSVSGRYLIDAITSASMKSRFDVDGVTSATKRASGGDERTFEEVRQEFGVGMTRRVGEGLGSLHGIYSRENDYTSRSLVASASYPLAEQNTELHLGFVRSWDRVFPVHREWTRDKDVVKLQGGLTQILSRRSLAQLTYTHTMMTGFLVDPYHVVTILDPDRQESTNHEATHPNRRDRNAIGLSVKMKTAENSAIELGYRRYWDSWSVHSNTLHGLFQQRLFQDRLTLGFEVRAYFQDRAEFFEPEYDRPQKYMSVDIRLESHDSMEYKLGWSIPGTAVNGLGIVDGTALDLDGSVSFYRRTTATADWHRRSVELNALVSRIGFRYRY